MLSSSTMTTTPVRSAANSHRNDARRETAATSGAPSAPRSARCDVSGNRQPERLWRPRGPVQSDGAGSIALLREADEADVRRAGYCPGPQPVEVVQARGGFAE